MRIRVKILDGSAGLPEYKTQGSSGFDFAACIDRDIVLKPCSSALVPTALAFEIPEGYEIQVRSRSGLAFERGIAVLNSPGTIDSDYRGEVKIILHNFSDRDFIIKDGDRIAQGVVCKVERCELVSSDSLASTARQSAGFGSTGR